MFENEPEPDLTRSLVPPHGLVFSFGLTLLVILLLTISGLTLAEFGWQYGESGGSALEKLHPATLLMVVLLLMSAIARGNPLRAILAALEDHPYVPVYLIAVLLLMAHAIFIAGLPFTSFIDTFIAPAIVLLLFRDIDEQRGHRLALLIHLLMFVNAALGIAEFAGGFRLTPLIIEGELLENEWRSSALLGHPLSNALLTGAYMAILLSGGGHDLSGGARLIAFFASAAGMVVFGGRAASALIILLIIWDGVRRFYSVLSGGPVDKSRVLAAIIGLPLLLVGIGVLADLGFFQLFLDRVTDDQGSASTRVEMFELFKHMTWMELIFGPDQAHIQTLMHYYGLDYGIESFWVAVICAHGLIAGLAFFAALFLFCLEIMRAAPGSVTPLIYFFGVASASLSLSAKTVAFSVFLLMTLILLRPTREAAGNDMESAEDLSPDARLVA